MIQIDWCPDRESSIAIRLQIIDYFYKKIESGEWPSGASLPSQRALAEQFDVNRSTIVSALSELIEGGVLESHGRGGTKVASEAMSFMTLSQAKWQDYIKEGIHMPNYKTIKIINDAEPNEGMIRLSSGEASPDIMSDEKMQYVLSEVSQSIKGFGYDFPKGMVELREQICSYLKNVGIDTSPSCIMICSGALQAFQLISIGLLQQGSTVFVENPSYIYSLQILQTLGMRRVGIPIDNEGIKGNLIPKQIRKSHASILYTIPNFQNPTGITMSLKRRKELISICEKERLPIIEDDVYSELWIDEKPPAALKSLDYAGNVLHIGSVSKTLSPGLRIGWIVGPETVISRLADIKMQMDYGSSSLSQMTVSKWFETGLYHAHLNDMRTALRKRRDFALQLLDHYFSDLGIWDIPKGGYYIWVKIHGKVSMSKVFEEAFNRSVLMYPGYIYGTSENRALRISYSYASFDDLEKGIRVLAEVIKSIMLK